MRIFGPFLRRYSSTFAITVNLNVTSAIGTEWYLNATVLVICATITTHSSSSSALGKRDEKKNIFLPICYLFVTAYLPRESESMVANRDRHDIARSVSYLISSHVFIDLLRFPTIDRFACRRIMGDVKRQTAWRSERVRLDASHSHRYYFAVDLNGSSCQLTLSPMSRTCDR